MFYFVQPVRRRISKGFIFLCIVPLPLIITSVSFAQIVLQGVTEEYAPYTYESQNGEASGIITEIANAIIAKAGLHIRTSIYPWARAYKIASKEPNTLIFSIFRTPEREELFHWIGPVIPSVDICLYKLKERTDIRLTSLKDARQYMISVVRDTIFHTYLLEHGFNGNTNIDAQADPLQNLKLLFFKRVDLVFAEEFENAAQLRELGLPLDQMEKTLCLPELKTEFYVAISKQTSKNIVQKLQAAFKEIEADGTTIPAIIEKYRDQFSITASQ
jgi:polar amino acid transport system substrate-binding protein